MNSTFCVLFVVKLLILFLFCFDSCGHKMLVDLLLACMPFLIFNFPLGLIKYTVILIYCYHACFVHLPLCCQGQRVQLTFVTVLENAVVFVVVVVLMYFTVQNIRGIYSSLMVTLILYLLLQSVFLS